ncbi:MAG: Spo0E family sporulation regulatory protein-aspartic acid phosphatase [Sporolactobacillus sp.]
MNKQQLTAKIEELRQQLFLVATKESLTSPNVQCMSQTLDQLLNKYERLPR